MKENKVNDYSISSGNIFTDLGHLNPQEKLAKAELARQINSLIEQKKLTQTQAAQLLEIDQPKVSALSTGKLSGFSLERLFRFLSILGQQVTIKISPKRRSSISVQVIVNVAKPKVIVKPRDYSNRPSIQARKKNVARAK